MATQIDWLRPTKAVLDLNQPECICAYLDEHLGKHKPELIIHTAAYTQVDAAETNAEYALAVNAHATEELARWAGQHGVAVLYVSTDYVFDGTKNTPKTLNTSNAPYMPQDEVNPLNAYGKSKWLGEQAVRKYCPRHWIVRSSWLHHNFSMLKAAMDVPNPCFAQTILSRLLSAQSLSVVDDQIGTPTTYSALANAIWHVLLGVLEKGERSAYGTYHVAGAEVMSWYALAQRVADYAWEQGMLDAPVFVQKVSSAEWAARQEVLGKTLAQRPMYSALRSCFCLDS